MLACERGAVDIVRTLLAHGAPWCAPPFGPTTTRRPGLRPTNDPFVEEKAYRTLRAISRDDLAAPFLPSRNELDNEGHCAGEWASASGHADLAEALIEHAAQAELVLGLAGRKTRADAESESESELAADANYLSQPVRYDGEDKLLDTENDAVMMDWEAPLMRRHADVVCASGGDVLNVGFGMGIFDGYVRDRRPAVRSHTIVEAHPDVYAHMRRQGWTDPKRSPNVTVRFGRWQDVLRPIAEANDRLPGGAADPRAIAFDGVFFDTYGEAYEDMRAFHELLPRIVRPGGTYSYFNGLAPDNIFFHAVYCRVAALELKRLGFETTFEVTPVDAKSDDIWRGVKRRYWWGESYFLPTCTLVDGRE
jgi:protein arginine N-methyltransferase 2